MNNQLLNLSSKLMLPKQLDHVMSRKKEISEMISPILEIRISFMSVANELFYILLEVTRLFGRITVSKD